MSMVINHNVGAQLALGELNKNVSKVGKLLAKVSSGMKINSAQDDASGYSISEKMREQIRSLLQDDQNVQNGSSLFKIAEGGIDNIVEELRNLKELAINSANDTNTDGDRLTIQKEFDQRKANINDIATETNYNTKRLLDGSYARMVVVGAKEQEYSEIVGYQERQIIITKPSITKILQVDGGTAVRMNNISVNLVENFEAVNPGINKLTNIRSYKGLKCDVGFKDGSWNWGNAMRTAFPGSYFTSYVQPSKYRQVGVSMNFDLPQSTTIQDLDGEGFNIQCGIANDDGCNQYINIVFDAKKLNANSTFERSTTDSNNITYTIGISDLTNVDNDSLSEAIFNGVRLSPHAYAYSNTPFKDYDISFGTNSGTEVVSTMLDSRHDVRVALNPHYDASKPEKGTKYIFTKSSTSLAMDFMGSGILIGTDAKRPDIGNEQTIYTKVNSVMTINEPIFERRHYEEDVYGPEGKPLIIHHGPKANLKTHFFISNMHTKFLGAYEIYINDATMEPDERIVNQKDRDRYYALSYDKDLQDEWLETLKGANKKSLDDIDVITKKNANIAIKVLEEAIDDAVDEATTMGSYLQRLEFTGMNITTMNENIQAAESTIRDADMAREMTEYTKFNILTQSAQSMLAQANQNSSAVLSLLQ